jgi:hypothetical protein
LGALGLEPRTKRLLGSWATINGAKLSLVGKMLGRKPPQPTAVYARLNTDALRVGMNATAAARMNHGKDGDK